MHEIDTLNIPAYQRKTSINKKIRASKKSTTRRKAQNISRPRSLDLNIQRDSHLSDFKKEKAYKRNSNLEEMKTCGIIEGYFEKINVCIVDVSSPIRVGDTLLFENSKGLFKQTIQSMQQDRQEINLARSGSSIGIQVLLPPIVGGKVYKVIE